MCRGFYGGFNLGNNAYYGGNGFLNYGSYGFLNNGINLLIIIGIIALIAFLVFSQLHRFDKKAGNNSSNAIIETLKLKYAQGEITEEEFLRRKELLNRN
jgi:putative membrane protein